MDKVKFVIALIGDVLELVKAAEKLFEGLGKGRGAEKLAWVKDRLIELNDGSEGFAKTLDAVWPVLAKIVASIVAIRFKKAE
jgi:hypothetical protein